MEVVLIKNELQAIGLMALACRTCTGTVYTSKSTATDTTNFVKKVLKSGHESIMEHVNFTFLIEGISRACSHQLVRYRHCSFSQLSQRYAKVGTEKEARNAHFNYFSGKPDEADEILAKYFVLPKEYPSRHEVARTFVGYHEAIARGVKPEEARALLPNCTKTNLLVTTNLRELVHICNERMCARAQGEIRELIGKMRDLVLENLPELKEFLVPKCQKFGVCTEEKSCGMMPKMEER